MVDKPNFAQQIQNQSHISVQRYFEISLLLMLGTGFLTVATTGKLDLVSIAVVSGALLVKLSSYVRDLDYSLSPRKVTLLAIFYIFFYALDLLVLSPARELLDRSLQAAVTWMLLS